MNKNNKKASIHHYNRNRKTIEKPNKKVKKEREQQEKGNRPVLFYRFIGSLSLSGISRILPNNL